MSMFSHWGPESNESDLDDIANLKGEVLALKTKISRAIQELENANEIAQRPDSDEKYVYAHRHVLLALKELK
jgi:hypothetical protein